MNRYMKIFIVLFFSTVVSAEQTSGYSLSVAGVGMSMDYREYGVTDSNGYGLYNGDKSLEKLLDSENSNFNEIVGADFRLSYKNRLESESFAELGVNMMFLSGRTEYGGSYIGSTSGYQSNLGITGNIVLDTSVDYLYTKIFHNSYELSYGLGLGYHAWRRELNPSQVEVYTWYSIRPKIALQYNFSKMSIGGKLEYQYGLSPKMTILQNSQEKEVSVNLGGVNILQLSIPLKFELYENMDLFMEYVYQYQVIDKSNRITTDSSYLWEPRSEANNQYLKFGATFKF